MTSKGIQFQVKWCTFGKPMASHISSRAIHTNTGGIDSSLIQSFFVFVVFEKTHMLFSLCQTRVLKSGKKNCSHMEIFIFVTVERLLKREKKTKWCSVWWDRWFIRESRVSRWSEFSTRFKNRPQKPRQWQLPVCATSRSWTAQPRLLIRRQEMFKALDWILKAYLRL